MYDWHSVGTQFKSRSKKRLLWLRLIVFLSPGERHDKTSKYASAASFYIPPNYKLLYLIQRW
jgi:hypothetical protein